ncbi:peptidase domain-containing ABC transporter [Brevundimonas sp.]|uniref:peptidase domain-containing ABC transporter n=1 Tax=Brevundimonas sp. TaxID=1871086 RepID=UPI002737D17C|nr:peptidase domain-containing ABC transporter [Brevundimonas sp.]MDP3803485.1 peptidase domain-containing ABC transporter [Brevundimonas sp.]
MTPGDIDAGFYRPNRKLQPILASEAAECGLACLAMVARHHGHDIDLNRLRQRFSVSITGATLRQLIDYADRLDLSSRALRVDLEALNKVQLPAIIHWNMAHFVVLEHVGPKGLVIIDPSVGRRVISRAEASGSFTGVALELRPSPGFSPLVDRQAVRLSDLWSRLTGLPGAGAQLLILSLILQLLVFVSPFQLQLVIDSALAQSDAPLLTLVAIAFAGVALMSAVIEAMRGWTLSVLINMMSYQVLGNVVRHMLRLPPAFFDRRHVGDVLSRLSSAASVQETLARGLLSTGIDGAMSLVALIIMFVYAPALAWVVVATTAVSAAIAALLFGPMKRASEARLTEIAREQTYLMETVRAAAVIRLMGREAEREGGWRNLFARVTNSSIALGRYGVMLQFGQSLMASLQLVLVIFLGARQVLAGDGFSIGMLMAFLAYRQLFSDRSNALLGTFISFRMVRLHLERLSDISHARPEEDRAGPDEPSLAGDLVLKDVAFAYDEGGREVVAPLSLTIRAGELIVITGASGGGKTTLMKLMMGLLQPTRGQIELAGRLATPATWRAWRARAGFVAQDDRLLSGSLADNISFFDPRLDLDRVKIAAASACVHADIVAMPMQYLTLVGDMGSSLSGGQKQRVLLARALYRDPSVLFLDEGTANLDVATEEEIVRLITRLPMTRIAVAHRPALIEKADRVFEMRAGLLTEISTRNGARENARAEAIEAV